MKYIICFALFLAILALCAFFYGQSVSTDYLGYDEADYMYAASKGLCANYFDKNAIPFSTFVEQGLRKGLKREERTSLSDFMRRRDDITFYRHYHGPLYFYALSLSRSVLGKSEHFEIGS